MPRSLECAWLAPSNAQSGTSATPLPLTAAVDLQERGLQAVLWRTAADRMMRGAMTEGVPLASGDGADRV